MRARGPIVLLVLILSLLPAPVLAQLSAQVVASGLSSPVAFIPDPATPGTFFIVQQGGRIRVLQNGTLLPADLINLSGSVLNSGEQGLLGMAFPPDAAASGRFFVNFTPTGGGTVVARFTRSPATALTVDPATRFDLRWNDGQPLIAQPFSNHKGGHLAFGPDGYLYIGLGDGGSGNDPGNRAQRPDTLLGKFLRINVSVPDSDPKGYTIPADNPFLDGQPIAALGEIWSFGWRNPWRYSFDDFGPGATGALIVGDVGQGAREEVDFEPAGAGGRNYGWRIREGLIATPGVGATTAAFLPLIDPILDYNRTIGRAVTGGYVYRGTGLPPQFHGRYFVADSQDSRVGSAGLSINPSTGMATVTDVIEHTAELGGSGFLGGIVSFGRDQSGELYLCTFAGRILKIVSAATPSAPRAPYAIVTGRTVSLYWVPPDGGPAPQAYQIEVGSAPGASNVLVASILAQIPFTTTNVPDGVYYVRLRAIAGGVLGPPSNEIVVTIAISPCTGPPPAPVVPARGGGGTYVQLAWNSVAGATSYIVEAGSATGLANLAQIPVSTRLHGHRCAAGPVLCPRPGGERLRHRRGVTGDCGDGAVAGRASRGRPAAASPRGQAAARFASLRQAPHSRRRERSEVLTAPR